MLKVFGDRIRILKTLDAHCTAFVKYKGAYYYVRKHSTGLYSVKPNHSSQNRQRNIVDWVSCIRKHKWTNQFKTMQKRRRKKS